MRRHSALAGAFLAAALAFGAPAEAQTEIWSANITTGGVSSLVGVWPDRSPAVGTIDDKDFDYGVDADMNAVTYNVSHIRVSSNGGLQFYLSAAWTSDMKSNLTLKVGSSSFALSDAIFTLSGKAAEWDSTGLSWSSGDSISLKLEESTTANNAPVFSDATLTREVVENTAANMNIGAVLPAATDADGDALTYTLEGTDAGSFDFDASARQLKTKSGVTYDHETKASYSVTLKASDGTDADTVAVTVNIADADEKPAKPAIPTVTATPRAPGTNTAPTGADQTVTMVEDTFYRFETPDFGFADADTGDALASVTIVTPPSAGSLAFYGEAVTANASVSRDDIDFGGLAFTPAANAHGSGYANFTFRVSDGTAQSASVYTMTIDVRGDDTLDALALSAGTLAPAFDPATEAYTASVANAVARITVAATASQDTAVMQFLDSDYAALPDADPATAGRQVDLAVGANTVKIRVTPADRLRTRTYTVLVTRAAAVPGDAALFDLALSAGTLAPAFDPATVSYTASVASSVARITVTPAASQGAAALAFLDAGNAALADADPATAGWQADLTAGANTIRVKVTAPDGTTEKTYTAVVTRMTSNAAPTGADVAIHASPDPGYIFRGVDFGFADSDAGDALASVTVVTLPSAGSLTLDGTAATAGQAVAAGDIDAGTLKYTVASGAGVVEDYASFTFRVSDGAGASSPDSTVSIHAVARPNPFGPPSETGVLIASTGLVFPAEAGGFSYRWVRVNGTMETDIPGATAKAYTLTPADVGKRIKVRAGQRFASGRRLESISKPFPESGTIGAARSCAAPVYTGGARQIWTSVMTVARLGPGNSYWGLQGIALFNHELDVTVPLGALDNERFSIGSSEYSPLQITHNTSDDSLDIRFEGDTPPESDLNRLVFHACDEAFAFRDRTGPVRLPVWTDTGLDWTIHGQRTLYLSYDAAAPTPVSTNRAGATVAVTFSEALDTDSVPAAGAFAVEVGGEAAALADTDPVAVSGRRVILTLAAAPAAGAAVTVAYTRPTGTGATPLRDLAHNEAADFGAQTAGDPPTGADSTVTALEDTAYAFAAGDFGFTGASPGATLAGVTVATLPSVGALTLDGAAVTANASVSRAELDAGELAFTAAANAQRDGLRQLHLQGERRLA